MHSALKVLELAAKGLLMVSETESAFEIIDFETKGTPSNAMLFQLAEQKESSKIEKVTVDYFFRNMVKVYPESTAIEKQQVHHFLDLQKAIHQTLPENSVYKIGEIKIIVLIIGKLDDYRWGGLKTIVVET